MKNRLYQKQKFFFSFLHYVFLRRSSIFFLLCQFTFKWFEPLNCNKYRPPDLLAFWFKASIYKLVDGIWSFMGHINFLDLKSSSELPTDDFGRLDSTLSVTTIKGVINIKANYHFEQFSFWVAASINLHLNRFLALVEF